ncbi:hypothetical protein WJX79_001213 [Trebouxia sp. C0005]
MLDSDQFAPGNNVDTVLLKNLELLAIKAAPGKTAGARYANVKSSDFFPQLEEVQDFKEYTVDKLKNVVKPYKWSFDIWDNSYLREQLGTKLKFVGCPFEDRVADNEYNKCVNAMPFLKLPHVPASSRDLEIIEPLLTHIREALCAGVVDDYEQFIAWVAHIAQNDVKIGWCPLFMSEQGTGKGLVLGTLLPNIFDKLALHVTNFSSVVERFNSDLAHKSYVFVDEGVFMGNKEDAEKMKALITEERYRHEAKFAEPESNPSNHNFAIASNHRKAVEVPNSERRFFLKAPLAIRWLKSAVMDNHTIMCYVPNDIQGDAERCEYAADIDQFRLKSRCESQQQFSNLIGDAFQEFMVQQDLKKFSVVKCKVPSNHVVATILQQFRGQRYMGGNEEDFLQAFKDLGIPVNQGAKVMNKKKTCIVFPSIEGLVYLLRKKNWMTAEEADSECDE